MFSLLVWFWFTNLLTSDVLKCLLLLFTVSVSVGVRLDISELLIYVPCVPHCRCYQCNKVISFVTNLMKL